MDIQSIAKTIAKARTSQQQCEIDWQGPAPDMEQALQIQTEVVKAFDANIIGWKVGATNPTAQQNFGLDGPFFGPMASTAMVRAGSDIIAAPTVMAVEPEYAFKMARDFPANGEEVTEETVSSAVASCHVALEVIGRCVKSSSFQNGIGLTMDFAGNSAFVPGPEIENWQEKDLVQAAVLGKSDGEVVHSGSGADVMGGPVTSLAWMAKTLADRGQILKAGDWVSTGTCTPPVPAKAGTKVSAQFGDFGEVSINFV